MYQYAQLLLEYDRATPEERATLLANSFARKEMQKVFKTISENSLVRALLEFRFLGTVPYEDFLRLQNKGLIETYGYFDTYVPVVRGWSFPLVRLTRKGEKLKVQGVRDYCTEQLCYEPFHAYRVRETGNGIVAGKETLEEWLDAGNEDFLNLLVDPYSGVRLQSTLSENANFFAEICDIDYREKLVRERSTEKVETSQTGSVFIYRS